MDPPGVAMVLPALLSSGVHVSLTRLPLMEYPGQDTLQLGDCPRTPSAMSLTDTPSGASPISSALSEPGCSAEDPVNNSIIAEDISATTLKTPTTKRKCGRPPKVQHMNCLPSPAVPVSVPMPPCLPAAASIHTPPAKVPIKRGRKSKAELLMIRLAQEAQAPESPSIQQERDSESEEPEVTPGGRPRRRAAKTARLFLQGVAEDWLTSDLSFLGEPEEASEGTSESSTTRRRIRRKGCSTENSVNNSIITEDNSATTLKTPTPKWKCGRPPKVQRMNCLPSPAVPVSVPMLPCLPAAASIHTPPAKVPNKRGRKSKAELLMIPLAQEAQAPESPSIQQERDSENEEPEVTPGGRPRRRAAKTAIRYLQDLAEELSSPGRISSPQGAAEGTPERSGKKKRRKRFHDDTEDDSDFVVSEAVLREMEKEEMENESDGSDSEMSAGSRECSEFAPKNLPSVRGVAENGFQNTIMAPTWRATQTTNDFRNSWHSNWEFPDWIPSVESWQVLSPMEAELYLPMHAVSPPFTIQREGIKQEGVPRTLNRFQSLPSHPDRWDMTFFTGGPVWAMDWCPTPEGSGSCQYLALYCHRGMDDRHRLDKVYSGPALLQLWSLGPLHMEKGAESEASFSYGLAVDQGCMWDMKFCPSGGWELPSTPRKSSHMARLGLLAVAFSSGHVEIYSLPHPECLFSYQKSQVKGHRAQELSVCRVDCVVRLQVGSIKSCTPGENGPCFTLAWLPGKPHQYLAAGFYDGTVSIWDLKTKSVLQRVRQGRVIKQYPFHSFLAHDHAVRSIEWCKADSNFLVTGGNDRRLKFWDFRRLYEPINVLKRFQSTEMSWLLSYCGVVVAQDNCYATHGLCGIHYVDSGFLGYKPYFVASRKGTVWSVSGSDWLSTIAAGDMNGEVIVVVLPNMNANSINTKRPANRRFPIYKTDFLHYAPAPPDSPHSDTELPAGPSANSDWENFKPKSFRAASGQFRLLFQDMDLTHFHSLPTREPVKRMQVSENNGDMSMERVRLEAVHKVRFNPNLECFAWVASGGHTGLVRVHCIQGLTSPTGRKLIEEKSAQFRAMYEETDLVREADYSPEVQHCVVQV